MSFNTDNTKLIVCPHCGKDVEDTYDLFRKDETEIEISCLWCDKRIKAEVTYIPKYSSCKAEDSD